MKPDWDKLVKEYTGHATGLVADVDCTAGGKALCEKVGVKGYPTIKYGDPNDLEDYEGGRSLDALQTFAKENLGPKCGPSNPDLCDEEKKALLDTFQQMSAEELDAAITAKNAETEKAESDFKEMLADLNKQFKEGSEKKDADLAEIKASGHGMMKAVLAHRMKSEL